jgi:hypothetical protein
MRKVMLLMITVLTAVSVAGCVTGGKGKAPIGKGKAPAPVVTKG